MKPNQIFDIMDLARRARVKDLVFNPLFVGPPGVGKSQIVQQWCRKNNLPFIDLRAAYLEAPDLIGFPSIETINGRQVTVHNTPEFWPVDGQGVLLLEEPNRGTTSVMNTFMQLLTDRKIHKYVLPEGWIVVGCINPEEAEYDVNTMDAALKDRFEIFNVEYNKQSFTQHMKESEWDNVLQMFVESNSWTYSVPSAIGNTVGVKYISPRTLSKLNAAIKAEIPQENEMTVYESILGKNVGMAFYHFKYDETPVLWSDIVKNKKKAFKKLEEFSNHKDLKRGHIGITLRDIVEKNEITEDQLAEIFVVLPSDQATGLVKDLEYIRKDHGLFDRLMANYPEVRKYCKSNMSAK